MSSDSSRKGKVRRRQEATGESYMRARRHLDGGDDGGRRGGVPAAASQAQLLALLGLDPAGLDVAGVWERHRLPVGTRGTVDFDPLMRVPIGLQAGGTPVWLDLMSDGPHGLLVGAAGSGKSVALRSLVFALCAQHAPEVLQLMVIGDRSVSSLVEFDGSAHNAAGMLDWSVGRAALSDLIDARERAVCAADAVVLDEDVIAVDDDEPLGRAIAGFDELSGEVGDHVLGQVLSRTPRSVPYSCFERYHRARAMPAGAGLAPLPFVFVVVDDLTRWSVGDDARWAAFLEVVMRKGRTLGVHVLAASQSLYPEMHRLLGCFGFRMALRTTTLQTSQDVIGSRAAGELPVSPGLGVFRRRLDEAPVPFRGFRVSGELAGAVGRAAG